MKIIKTITVCDGICLQSHIGEAETGEHVCDGTRLQPQHCGGWRAAAILREPGQHSETLWLREILKTCPLSIIYYVTFILHFIVWVIT